MRGRTINDDTDEEDRLLDSITMEAPFYSPSVSFYPLTAFTPSSFHQYTLSWIESAHGSFHHISQDGGMRGNYLGYAVAGIHRHAVELALKEIIHRCNRLGYGVGAIRPERLGKSHDVAELARAASKGLEDGHWDDDTRRKWRRIEAHLQRWQSGDMDGFALRYPVNTKGARYAYDHGMDFSRAVLVGRAVFRSWETITAWLDAMEQNEREARLNDPQTE